MKTKLLFVAGLGAGYVLGSRAGRERYEQIRSAAENFWNDPKVQRGIDQAEDVAASFAPDIPALLGAGVTKVTRQLFSRSSSNAASARSGGKRRRKTSTTMKPATPAPSDAL